MTIELGPPGPFMAGVLAGTKALDALDVPGETTLEQQAAFFWLHVGTSMASADLVDAEAQALFVEGAKTRAPSLGTTEGQVEGPDEDDLSWAREDLGASATDDQVQAVAEQRAAERSAEWAREDLASATDDQMREAWLNETRARIPAVRIWLHRLEGHREECTEHTFEGPDVWKQSRDRLVSWAVTAPDDGTIDKTAFKVTYADGQEYAGTFGLQRDDVNLPAHMRRHLEHLLAHPEVYAKFVEDARKFLDLYEIGPNV